jgi:hypothetical protein
MLAARRSTDQLGADMRVVLTMAIAGVALFFQHGAQADQITAQRLASAKAVVLVKVEASAYPRPDGAPNYYMRSLKSTATLRVTRSWIGPYPVGAIITVETQQLCSGLCSPYPFQLGQEVVVFIGEEAEPIHASVGSVIDGPMVDQAVREMDMLAVKTGT